jgi:glycosyltransferase involved in cell wall biosynthesis
MNPLEAGTLADSGEHPRREKPLRVFVHLVEGFGARSWAQASDAARISGVVDHLPYGYYRAGDENCTIRYSEDRAEWHIIRLLRLSARRLLGFDLLHAWRNRRGIFDADVVWTHTELEHLAVLLLLKLVPRGCRPKLIAQSVWLYDRWNDFPRPKRWLYRKLLSEADILTVLSPENLKIARRLFPNRRVELVKFGIEHETLRPAFARKIGSPVRILALGRDMHRDWPTLIDAVRGWNGAEVRIGAKTMRRGLLVNTHNVSLVSPHTKRDVIELYRWADIVVLPLLSNSHASGITVLEESALFGVPVVSTDTGGLRAYFTEDEVRYVPVGDSSAMRLAIEELALDDQLRYTLAKKAQERMVRDGLNSHVYALRHREISQQLVRRHNDSPATVRDKAESSSAAPTTRVFVFLGHGFGASWSRGELPGLNEEQPYGYHHAAESGCDVTYSRDAPENRLTRLFRLGARRLIGFDLLHAWRNRRNLFDTDVVWTHTELEHLAVLMLWRTVPRKRRPKLIAQCIWLFDKWERFSPPKRWLYRKLMAQTDVLAVQTLECLSAARRIFPGVRTYINPYGTHKRALRPVASRSCHNPIRVLSLGRDMHRDWATLIEAVKDWEPCEVRIGGRYINPAASAGARNIQLVTPDNTQLRELYEWADVVVVALKPNLHISGITVIMEAVLMGVPVICTDTGGLRLYFSDEEITYVPPRDVGVIRRAIERLATDDVRRVSMVRKAQEKIERADLTTDARARRMAQLSRELLTEHGAI